MTLFSTSSDDSPPHAAIVPALSWASIALAVFTALCQGLVSALAYMTEASSHWTFRFRLALVEHIWWTAVSFLLLASLVMSGLAFASGTGGDPVSVLALSSATFLAMVQYMLPAWKARHYVLSRWFAWTGDSRTAIKGVYAPYCRGPAQWAALAQRSASRLAKLQPTPSDWYGWVVWPTRSIPFDPTDILRMLKDEDASVLDSEYQDVSLGLYANADDASPTVSLLWGSKQGFRRRVSRAISSMPLDLLRSSPRTIDGYDGRGLALAMGVLGRNKGLKPWTLVYESNSEVSSYMENASSWAPRPSKVLRSFYKQTLQAQYHGLGESYVSAAVELGLLLLDVPHDELNRWFALGLEQQCPETSQYIASCASSASDRQASLACLYEASYVAMVISLNAMRPVSEMHMGRPCRPELLCAGLLMKARGIAQPAWWNTAESQRRRKQEIDGLSPEVDWRLPSARLLGLSAWPTSLDAGSSSWLDDKTG